MQARALWRALVAGGLEMFKEFREFAIKGNAFDLAVAVIFGAAFGAIVQSIVNDLINPLIGLLLGRTDLTNLYFVLAPGKSGASTFASVAAARTDGASVFAYGAFLNAVASFLLIAVVLFFVVKALNRLKREEVPTHKDCPFCLTAVPVAATRCPACTSQLEA